MQCFQDVRLFDLGMREQPFMPLVLRMISSMRFRMFGSSIALQAILPVDVAFCGGSSVGSIVSHQPERHVFAKIQQNTGGSAYLCENGGDKIMWYNM